MWEGGTIEMPAMGLGRHKSACSTCTHCLVSCASYHVGTAVGTCCTRELAALAVICDVWFPPCPFPPFPSLYTSYHFPVRSYPTRSLLAGFYTRTSASWRCGG